MTSYRMNFIFLKKFDCKLLHVTYEVQSDSTLHSLPECQETPCLKQAPYPKFKWLQKDLNPQPLSS